MTPSRYTIVLLLLCCSATLFAQHVGSYMFRIYLKDKAESPFELSNPGQFLSSKAIARRAKQGIAITKNDLPVSDAYVSIVEALNCKVVAKSKWMNTIAVVCEDSLLVDQFKTLSFVSDAKFVWKGGINNDVSEKKLQWRNKKAVYLEKTGKYGAAVQQILIHEADTLHKMGYKGEGMEIAVIDAGFNGMDQEHLLLSTVSVKGAKDFVYKGGDMYQGSNHGTQVLSCMGTNTPNTFVGTAPKASYWLLRSEDSRSEFPIEEDYWAAAAEYADSLGVDIINTSLGYSKFDFPAQSYTYSDMDGKTAYITQAAEIAASKGMVLVLSAGNEGAKAWKYITAPADSDKGLTIGAIAADSIIASFSSQGPTFDGRIKPDVVAIGQNTAVVNQLSEIVPASGTSFSAPVMCGIAACFWQANPDLSSKQVVDILKQSGNRYSKPDNDYGCGIPNIPRALEIIRNMVGIESERADEIPLIKIVTEPANDSIRIIKETDDRQPYTVSICTMDGRIMANHIFSDKECRLRLSTIQGKIIVIKIQYNNTTIFRKIYW